MSEVLTWLGPSLEEPLLLKYALRASAMSCGLLSIAVAILSTSGMIGLFAGLIAILASGGRKGV